MLVLEVHVYGVDLVSVIFSGVVVSMSDYHARGPGSIPDYTLEIFLGV